MLEVLSLFRANGFKTFIVTGGGQDFVRVFPTASMASRREQVVGTAGGVKYGYDKDGRPVLTKEPKLLLNDNFAGKPEGIHLVIGRRPQAAFGNSTGDQQMLEYTKARRRRTAVDARAARRRDARIRLWARPGLPAPASAPSPRRSMTRRRRRLVCHQHEGRLESHLRVREVRDGTVRGAKPCTRRATRASSGRSAAWPKWLALRGVLAEPFFNPNFGDGCSPSRRRTLPTTKTTRAEMDRVRRRGRAPDHLAGGANCRLNCRRARTTIS